MTKTIIHELQKYTDSLAFQENLAIDFPSVSVSLDCIEVYNGIYHCNVRIEFQANELLEDRLHYYMIGYTAHKLNS